MKKICCNKFEFFYSADKTWGLNIRVIKLSDKFKERGDIKIDKAFFITEGYEGEICGKEKSVAINYCPFCGTKLQKFYGKDDSYVHEIMDI